LQIQLDGNLLKLRIQNAGRGRPEAALRAGLEFVEKLLTWLPLLDETERENATRVPSVASLVELATSSVSSSSWSSSQMSRASSAKLLDLD
jgi:hypothetical protein